MPILTITDEEILRLCRLDTADAQNIADAGEVRTRQQDAVEATLRPSALTDASLTALLRRTIAKKLAAELLAMRSREEGVAPSVEAAGIAVRSVPDHAARLAADADAVLLPYRKRAQAVEITRSG